MKPHGKAAYSHAQLNTRIRYAHMYMHVSVEVLVALSCPTLCNPMDWDPAPPTPPCPLSKSTFKTFTYSINIT